MFEFRVATLKPGDEVTVDHGQTWLRVTRIASCKKQKVLHLQDLNHPASNVALVKNPDEFIIVR